MGMVRAWALIGAAAMVVVACGQSASSATFVATTPASVVLVQWTAEEGTITTGVLRETRLEDDNRQVESTSLSFTGVLAGADLSLTFFLPLAGNMVVTGTLDGDRLTLFWPTDDGDLQPIRLESATVDRFNLAVVELQTEAATRRAADEAAASDLAQLVEANSRLRTAIYEVDTAVERLEEEFGYAADDFRWAEQLLAEVDEYLDTYRQTGDESYLIAAQDGVVAIESQQQFTAESLNQLPAEAMLLARIERLQELVDQVLTALALNPAAQIAHTVEAGDLIREAGTRRASYPARVRNLSEQQDEVLALFDALIEEAHSRVTATG